MNTIILLAGIWRATLGLPGADLPFQFEVQHINQQYTIQIINGEERITVDEITFSGDSVFIRMPVFDSEIRALMMGKGLSGEFINYARKTNQRIPFRAEHGIPYRFKRKAEFSTVPVIGRWETVFSPGTPDSSRAIGVFETKVNGTVSGTFLTPSGDYRYLEGCMSGDSLYLSSFDGAFAFLFMAHVSAGNMNGVFMSGNHRKEPFVAKRNEGYRLPDPYSITWLRSGYDRIDFSLPDLEGETVTMKDKRFRNKVVILQIMGSWCPNCLDESAFMTTVYDKYKGKGLEIAGLSFEKTSDFSKAVSNVNRLKKKYHITYPLLIANKDSVVQTLPMLGKISGYPTTIYIDRKGKVRKIYTGFSGPATGNEYEKYKEDFFMLLEKLLEE